MKIRIVGTGNMGRALGLRWARARHEVLFGSRDLNKAGAIAANGSASTQAGDFDAAAVWQRSAKTTNHHFTLAFGPVPAPGWRRLSSPVFSPGTGSPLAVVSVVAQPLSAQIAAVRRTKIDRCFIRAEI